MTISLVVAKQFFSDLYEEAPDIPDSPAFDKMTTKLVTTLGPTTSTGDQALQSLMFNYILSDPSHAEKGKPLTAVLGNIKQQAVMEFAKTFPNANLEELMNAAKASGYDVEILKN